MGLCSSDNSLALTLALFSLWTNASGQTEPTDKRTGQTKQPTDRTPNLELSFHGFKYMDIWFQTNSSRLRALCAARSGRVFITRGFTRVLRSLWFRSVSLTRSLVSNAHRGLGS